MNINATRNAASSSILRGPLIVFFPFASQVRIETSSFSFVLPNHAINRLMADANLMCFLETATDLNRAKVLIEKLCDNFS